jgi:hypothetical protein
MVRRKASGYEPAIPALFDEFVRRDISRRRFIDHAAVFSTPRSDPDAAAPAWSPAPEFYGQQLR